MYNRLSFKNAQVGGGEGGAMSMLVVDPKITTRIRVITSPFDWRRSARYRGHWRAS